MTYNKRYILDEKLKLKHKMQNINECYKYINKY